MNVIERQEKNNTVDESNRRKVDALVDEASVLMGVDEERMASLARKAARLAEKIGYRRGYARALLRLSITHMHRTQLDECLKMAEESLRVSREESYLSGQADALAQIGGVYFHRSGYAIALKHFHESLELYETVPSNIGIANALNRLGLLYLTLGEFPRATEYLQQGLLLFRELEQSKGEAAVLTNLALLHEYIRDFEKALDFARAALDLYRESGSRHGETVVLGNMSSLCGLLGDYDTSVQLSYESLHVAREIGDRRRQAHALENIGDIYLKLDQPRQALPVYEEMLALALALGESDMKAYATLGIARCQVRLGDTDEALSHAREAYELLEQSQTKKVRLDGFLGLTDVYKRLGDFQTALQMHKRFRRHERSFVTEESGEKVRRLQILHETDQAHKEAEIHRLKNVEMVAANERLEALVRTKNEFLGIAAHDLKNPIANINLLAAYLRKHASTLSPAEINEMFSDIQNSAAHMINLVTRLLDVNRIDQGQLSITTRIFDLGDVTRRFLAVHADRAGKKNIQVHFEGESERITAYADPDVTVQVLDNIISNAVKYSPPGTNVYVRVTTVQVKCGVRARVEIQDEGPGIVPEEMPRLFEKFTRLSARPTGGEDSTGLGLAIVKQLVETMHGRVWCQSTPGDGATFIVELPGEEVGD